MHDKPTIITLLKVQLSIRIIELHIVPWPHCSHCLIPPLVALEVVPCNMAQPQYVDAHAGRWGRGSLGSGLAVLVDESLEGWLWWEFWQRKGRLPKRVCCHLLCGGYDRGVHG